MHPDTDPQQDPNAPPQSGDTPAIEGEGNYTAARRHRESLKQFIDSDRVDQAAADAAPATEQEERELRDAEAEGRSHARQ